MDDAYSQSTSSKKKSSKIKRTNCDGRVGDAKRTRNSKRQGTTKARVQRNSSSEKFTSHQVSPSEKLSALVRSNSAQRYETISERGRFRGTEQRDSEEAMAWRRNRRIANAQDRFTRRQCLPCDRNRERARAWERERERSAGYEWR